MLRDFLLRSLINQRICAACGTQLAGFHGVRELSAKCLRLLKGALDSSGFDKLTGCRCQTGSGQELLSSELVAKNQEVRRLLSRSKSLKQFPEQSPGSTEGGSCDSAKLFRSVDALR
jgi:hypothetical protein